jgi:hypothetical protein
LTLLRGIARRSSTPAAPIGRTLIRKYRIYNNGHHSQWCRGRTPKGVGPMPRSGIHGSVSCNRRRSRRLSAGHQMLDGAAEILMQALRQD